MSKVILILAILLLFALAIMSCDTKDQDRPEEEGAYDAHIVTIIPPPETAVEVEPTQTVSRYEDIQLTGAEMDTLACVIWLEARGEGFEGQQAVAEVVFNRMLSPDFPDTLDEVIYQKGQFSTASSIPAAEPDEMQYIAINAALCGPHILPLEVVFFSQAGENDNVWGTIGGHVFCYPYYWEGEAE